MFTQRRVGKAIQFVDGKWFRAGGVAYMIGLIQWDIINELKFRWFDWSCIMYNSFIYKTTNGNKV